MIKFWKNEGPVGRVVWCILAVTMILLFFGVIDGPEYGSGARR